MAYANQDAEKAETNEQPFNPTKFENLPDLSDVVVCPSETGSNSYDCLLEAILLPIQYRDVFVGLRSPWKGGTNASALCLLLMQIHPFASAALRASWHRNKP
jgi:hypothetical protein